MERLNGRTDNALREVRITRNFTDNAEGSVLVECGRTRVLCTVSAVTKVPHFQKSKGHGWLTAEYSMLPGSVQGRKAREFQKRDGRSIEIQRLIGRTLRAVVDLSAFPDFSLHVDCDVLQADGGTRCASITGAAVALHDALQTLKGRGQLRHWPMKEWLAAVSVGVVAGREVIDLDYGEDFEADVDMNVIATASGKIIEVQGTAEGDPFEREVFDRLVDLALGGISELTVLQAEAVGDGVEV
ncbi:MAG: ribonuclease PH [Planctomycetota bacterium]|jgi:ribonuclease PH|nr:MAG: ribonuclease PH [Planctomycetota bacterium]